MDFHKIFTTVYPILREHRVAAVLSIVGLIFLVYGLISSLASSNTGTPLVFDEENTASVSAKIKTGEILVDVEGAVVKPGVYSLRSDARIRDGLIAASGLSSNANREWVAKNINLAGKLVDGGKIYIPTAGQDVKGAAAGIIDSININTASIEQLDALSGIGPATGQKIIDNRPYGDIQELVSKKVLTTKVFEKIKDKITVY